MVELIGTIVKINPKLVTINCAHTILQLPIKDPTIYIALLKLRSFSNKRILFNVKLVTDAEKGYVIGVQVRYEGEWRSLTELK